MFGAQYMKKEVKPSGGGRVGRPQSSSGGYGAEVHKKKKLNSKGSAQLPRGMIQKQHNKHHSPHTSNYKSQTRTVHTDYEKFRPESRQRLKDCSAIHEDLVQKLNKHGEGSEVFILSLRDYAQHACSKGQDFMAEGDVEAAKLVLREAEVFIKAHARACSAHTLYQINNNLASLANKKGNVKVSLRYLEAALDAGNDPRLVGKDACNLGETVLNMANANNFLGNFPRAITQVEQGYGFAGKIAAQLQAQIGAAEEAGESPEVIKALGQNFLEQINLLILCRHSKGQILEKTRNYERAIREYKAGKKLVEIHLGTQHQFYSMMASACGGAKLRAKTMGSASVIKEHQSRKISGHSSSKHVTNSVSIEQEAHESSKVLSRRGSKTEHQVKRRIQKEIQYASMQRNEPTGIFLANCETWEKCHQRTPSRNSSAELREIRMNANRSAGLSAKKERRTAKLLAKQERHRRKVNVEWPRRSIEPVHDEHGTHYNMHPPLAKQDAFISTTPRARSQSNSLIHYTSGREFKKYRSGGMRQQERSMRSMDVSTAASMIQNSPMRLICKNGPGCKNHDWYRAKGFGDHTKFSHHGSSVSQPVGGGYQIAYKKSAKKEVECCTPTPRKRSATPCKCAPAPTDSKDCNCRKTCTRSTPTYQQYCDNAQSERLYQQQMSNLRNVQEEQFKMLTIMLEQEAQTNACCPVPPMSCMPIPGEAPVQDTLYEEDEEEPQPFPNIPAAMAPPTAPPAVKQPRRLDEPEEEDEVKSNGSCLSMKRREIDLELAALKRETYFQAVELKRIIDVDHDDAMFEKEFQQQLLKLENHPDLAAFRCCTDKVVEPIRVTARVRCRSELDHHSGIDVDNYDELSSYESDREHEYRLHVVDKQDAIRLEAFRHLENAFESLGKRRTYEAFGKIYQTQNIVLEKPQIEERKHIFINEYKEGENTDVGEYHVIEFLMTQEKQMWVVAILEVVEASDKSYMKVVVTNYHDDRQCDYLRLDNPLIIELRYLAYFIRATLVISLTREGGIAGICLDQLKWDGIKDFQIEMKEKERKFGLRPIGYDTYNEKVINDNHQMVLDKEGNETKVKTGLSTDAKKSRQGAHSELSQGLADRNRSLDNRSNNSIGELGSNGMGQKRPSIRPESRGRMSSVKNMRVSFREESGPRAISPGIRSASNGDLVSLQQTRQTSENGGGRKRPFSNNMIREVKSAQKEETQPAEGSVSANTAKKSEVTNYNEDMMLATFYITRTLARGENVDYLVRVYDKGQRDEGTGRFVIQCISKEDPSDWKQIEPNLMSNILNAESLAEDINNQLMVYRRKHDGRIDYLALVDNPQYNNQITPTRKHRDIQHASASNSLNIKQNQMNLLDMSKHNSRDCRPNESATKILLEAAAINAKGHGRSAQKNPGADVGQITNYIEEHTSQGIIQFHHDWDIDQCHDNKPRTDHRRELTDTGRLSVRDSLHYQSPSRGSGKSPSKSPHKKSISQHQSSAMVPTPNARSSEHGQVASYRTLESNNSMGKRVGSFGQHLLIDPMEDSEVIQPKSVKKPTRLKTVRNLVTLNKLYLKYIVKELTRNHWVITIKDMNTQKFLCQDVQLPQGIFDGIDRNKINEEISQAIERHVRQHEESYNDGVVPRRNGVLVI